MRLLGCMLLLAFLATAVVAQQKQPSAVDTFKRQLRQAKHDSTRIKLCTAIAWHYSIENKYDSVYPYTQRGLQLLISSPSHQYTSELYYLLAMYYRDHALYQKGILLIQQAIYHAQQERFNTRLTDFQYSLAMFYMDAGELSKAVDQIDKNVKYLQLHENNSILAANYLLIIDLFKIRNNTAMQEVYTNRYLALVKPSWPIYHSILAYSLKAEVLEKRRRFKEARAMYQKALHYARLSGNSAYIIDVLSNLGVNLRHQQQNQAALQAFSQTLALSRDIKNIPSMASSKRELAITYLACQQPKEALHQGRDALKLARQNKQASGIVAALNSLVIILEANGRYQEALHIYQEEQQLKEQQFTEKNAQKIAQIQAEFDAETKEKTISILQKNAQITQLKTLRQQQQLALAQRTQVAAATIIGLLLLLTGLVYYFLRKSQRNYSALTHQQQLLQQTASALAETNTIKDKLFSMISHDLRSPVASMKTNIQQIQEVDKQSELLEPLLGRLEKQVDNVLLLLTNLLDWSMIQLKGFQLFMQPMLLHEITEETISQASELIQQKQLILIDQVDKTVMVMADKHQVRAVVRNILGNAIKFTPVGGYIRIQSIAHQQWVELQIRDSGVGMSAEQITTLFTSPEVRTGTMGESGVGLGLRICREMLDRQGGTIHIDSPAKGGTLVCIRLAAFSEQSKRAKTRLQGL